MKNINLQDVFLNNVRKNKISVTIHVTNGFQIKKAFIKSYDNFVIMLEYEGKQMLIYKHAISSITPDSQVEVSFDKGDCIADE